MYPEKKINISIRGKYHPIKKVTSEQWGRCRKLIHSGKKFTSGQTCQMYKTRAGAALNRIPAKQKRIRAET